MSDRTCSLRFDRYAINSIEANRVNIENSQFCNLFAAIRLRWLTEEFALKGRLLAKPI